MCANRLFSTAQIKCIFFSRCSFSFSPHWHSTEDLLLSPAEESPKQSSFWNGRNTSRRRCEMKPEATDEREFRDNRENVKSQNASTFQHWEDATLLERFERHRQPSQKKKLQDPDTVWGGGIWKWVRGRHPLGIWCDSRFLFFHFFNIARSGNFKHWERIWQRRKT